MRPAAVVLVLAIAAVWGIAIAAWPELPARVPIHFDALGRADGWVDKSAFAWFGLPALATVVGIVVGLLLPRWMVAMARANSKWLNVPRKTQFMALPVDARERAIRAPMMWLVAMVIGVEALFAWILYGSAEVAAGGWESLPPLPLHATLGAVVLCVVAMVTAGLRAVQREVARAEQQMMRQ
jgi:uncharacterized membrane protein